MRGSSVKGKLCRTACRSEHNDPHTGIGDSQREHDGVGNGERVRSRYPRCAGRQPAGKRDEKKQNVAACPETPPTHRFLCHECHSKHRPTSALNA